MLYSLNLQRNEFSEEGVKFLSRAACSSRLKELDISDNLFKVQGIKNLREYLVHENCELQTLKIRKCGLLQYSRTLLFTSMTSRCTIRDLDCTDNNLGG